MKRTNCSRKRILDDRCRSESESSYYSSSLKSYRAENGYSNKNYKRITYSRNQYYSRPKESFNIRNESFREKKRKFDRKNDYSPCRKRIHYSDGSESIAESVVEKDKDGYLIMKENAIVNRHYKIIKQLGEGTFGRVVHCKHLCSEEEIAIKVIRDISKYREAARLELKVLDLIKKYDPKGRKLVITALDSFDYHGHICIIFPLLGPSIFDFLKSNHYSGYPMHQVQYMSYQICIAVEFLHSLKLTHTDLKPENILIVNGACDIEYNESTKRNVKVLRDATIRIIDLGSATFENEHHTSIVATRHYRPLEVVLGLGWSYPCDVWSVGCILFELYTGVTMFMTHDNLEHLAMMERILGPLPRRMTYRCRKQKYFYADSGALHWDYESKAGRYVRGEVKPLRRYITRPNDEKELNLFDLIQEMLEYNPNKRITMRESLRHPYIRKFNDRQRSRYGTDGSSNNDDDDDDDEDSDTNSVTYRRNSHCYQNNKSHDTPDRSVNNKNVKRHRNYSNSRSRYKNVKSYDTSDHSDNKNRKRHRDYSSSYTAATSRRRQ